MVLIIIIKNFDISGGYVMELRNIVTFLRVAETGSFTGAANQLGYVQSTVSIQIKQLEKELGIVLFDRIGKNVKLTSNGQNFISYANQLVKISEQAKQICKLPEKLEGELRIGILESLLIWVLSEQLLQYNNAFPLIRIRTKTGAAIELLQMLKHNKLDIVYLLGKKLYSKDFVCAWSEPVKLVFVTHPENPIITKKGLLLKDIVKQPLVLTEISGFTRRVLDETAIEKGIIIQPLFEIDNTSAIIKLLKKGLGVSLLPEYAVKESVMKNELIIIDVDDCFIQFWSQLFYHKDKWLTPQIESFINIIKNRSAFI
jgi:Transcriptional regulator